ncbi:MAG: fluoride efflux transporter CrcB [Burkholderiales bacterium]
MIYSMLAVAVGAGLGAVWRWGLGEWLNPLYAPIPLGTLAANLIGGLLVGAAVAYFTHQHTGAPEWRLFVITGFLGGLTTFSTFSMEVVNMIERHDYGWALGTAGVHLAGSLLLAGIGLWLGNALLQKA